VRWEGGGEGQDQGDPFIKSKLEWIYPHPDTPPGAVGGAKEIVNTLGRRAAADLSESTGIRFVEKGTGREIDLAAEGKDLLPPTNVAQMQGVQIVRDSWAAAAAVSTIMAVGSKFRSVVRNPEEFAADLKKVLTHTVSQAEALEQAHRHSGGHRRHGGYIDRYHVPDDIVLKDGRLTEWEAKASKTDSTSVAKDKHGNKQGARDKNLLRAKTMTRKEKKIGMPSNRQGGPYTGGRSIYGGVSKTWEATNNTSPSTPIPRPEGSGSMNGTTMAISPNNWMTS